MFIRVGALALAFAACVVAADARQAISVSLAECAAIFGEMSSFNSAASTPERRAMAARLSAEFKAAATTEAAREGVPDPDSHVATAFDEKRSEWSGKIRSVANVQDTKDWIDYCRAVGKSRSVPDL